ncbi:unknown [Acetobacter sp. CAG:267]|nr:unknown [Acetobacter sp. CAG:267]
MENAIRHNKTPEERKAALEEALRRVRPVVLGHNEPVGKRLEQFANRPIDEQTKTSDRKKALKPLSLAEMAKKGTELEKKAEKAGIDLKGPGLAKDIDEKNKEKKKEKEKDKEKELTPEKQEQKMKEMFSKVRLPSGMEIHQEGPSWVLVSKDGKQRTDVTDVMNTIDKFNRNVDAANEENRMQNNVQNSADRAVDASQKDLMKNDGLQINEISGKATMIGDALPMVKDIDGNQVFKPEDVKAVAETALAISDEKMKLERLADPKALEQMKKREKDNEDKAEARRKAMMLYNQRHNGRGGREPTA